LSSSKRTAQVCRMWVHFWIGRRDPNKSQCTRSESPSGSSSWKPTVRTPVTAWFSPSHFNRTRLSGPLKRKSERVRTGASAESFWRSLTVFPLKWKLSPRCQKTRMKEQKDAEKEMQSPNCGLLVRRVCWCFLEKWAGANFSFSEKTLMPLIGWEFIVESLEHSDTQSESRSHWGSCIPVARWSDFLVEN